jgi:hypothetical protein
MYGRSHSWNIDHEASLIETYHLMGQLSIPGNDDPDVVRAPLNIEASQGLRQIAFNDRGRD